MIQKPVQMDKEYLADLLKLSVTITHTHIYVLRTLVPTFIHMHNTYITILTTIIVIKSYHAERLNRSQSLDKTRKYSNVELYLVDKPVNEYILIYEYMGTYDII